jgi:hypothetical protein
MTQIFRTRRSRFSLASLKYLYDFVGARILHQQQMKTVKPITVGLELEMLKLTPVASRLIEVNNFGRRTDASIADKNGVLLPKHGPGAGVELVTPILEAHASLSPDGDECEFDVSTIASNVRSLLACAATYNSSCGLHVHLGRPNGETTEWNPKRLLGVTGGPASEWKPGHIRTMLLIGLGLENIIFNLVPESRKQSRHCRKLREVYTNQAIQAYYPLTNLHSRKQENPQRYCWLNLIETRRPQDPAEERVGYARSKAFGTFEVRALGETVDYDYIMAWVKLWVKVAAAVAYLPAESAALRCLYSGWLQNDIDDLRAKKEKHEREVAPDVRSILPNVSVAGMTTEE